jgi:hypothetical protein
MHVKSCIRYHRKAAAQLSLHPNSTKNIANTPTLRQIQILNENPFPDIFEK